MRVGLVYLHALAEGGYPRDIRWLAAGLTACGIEVILFSEEGMVCTQKRGICCEYIGYR